MRSPLQNLADGGRDCATGGSLSTQHVRNAVARFDRVIDVSDADRALAFANIEKAAEYYNVNLAETSWRDLGIHKRRCRQRRMTCKRRVQS